MGILGGAIGAVTGPYRFYAELAVAGTLVVACGVQTGRLDHAETKQAETAAAFSEYQAQAERQHAADVEAVRKIEQDTAGRLERISNGADQRIAAAAAAAASAALASDSLRARVATLVAAGRRTCPGVAAPAGGGASAPDPIGVLADVLGRADTRAGILAAESDRRRERALACEDSYEVNRDASLKANGR